MRPKNHFPTPGYRRSFKSKHARGSGSRRAPSSRPFNPNLYYATPTAATSSSNQIFRSVTFLSLLAELLAEICRYLAPLNVLWLARTSKFLRLILMSKKQQLPWQLARRSIGIPEPDKTVCEPQLASFLFERGCQTPGCDSMEYGSNYTLCIRYCTECGQNSQLNMRDIRRDWPSMPNAFEQVFDSIGEDTFGMFPTMWRSMYVEMKLRFREINWSDKNGLTQLRNSLVKEAAERTTRGVEISTWAKRHIASKDVFPNSVYTARKEEIIRRLVDFCEDFDYTLLHGFARSSGLEILNKYARQSPQWFTDQEWLAMRPQLVKAVRQYQKRLRPPPLRPKRPFNLDMQSLIGPED